ncbi:MAG: protein kinase [Planctomycetes bacterium]|nr:protein kinase [Planctomycetota bacterium]
MTRESSPESPVSRDPLEELAEAFLERYRRGERPSITEFTARAPEHADEIRELFPALVVMEQAAPAVTSAAAHPHGSIPLERLGDYRVIREIGRGGMGIVYEAEQEALGRHVALKVLPSAAGVDSNCLLRFRREARSAARLHHTNIVPVFDIGERDGIHYYAMQFIQGHSLDAVIAELRALRKRDDPQQKRIWPAGMDVPQASAAVSLAGSLLSGQFRGEELAVGAGGDPSAPNTANGVASEPRPTEIGEKPLAHGTSSVLGDTSDFSAKSDFQFYRSVARIGLQVAEALAYAHGQRVLHRDIKPSNLLLDARGTIWVTDFGLAKEEGGDVTRTGELVGTLRYMAPERLNGNADGRSDIYSLGLTLYELLTLRPAFPEADRARLVHTIAHQEPGAPRKFDPQIPRDLETIVLKAITKETAGRYAVAEDMAEDLRRFLADRPIRARRASTWERTRRWCRRNPGWAATIAGVLGLLLVMAIGGTILSLHLQQALHDVRIADADKTEKLCQGHIERARALRTSGRVGQRFEALKAIREAAKIKVTPDLRDEAVAALVLPDVEVFREWGGPPEDTWASTYDASFELFARIDKQGLLTVCRLSADGVKVICQSPTRGKPPFAALAMSSDGRYLVFGHEAKMEAGLCSFQIWKFDGAKARLHWEERGGLVRDAISFHADGRRLALGHGNGTISIHDLQTKALLNSFKSGWANSLAFHPRDSRLAVAGGDSIRILDVDSGKELKALRHPKIQTWAYGLAWHPEGRLLAATSQERKIHLWDVETGAETMPPWEAFSSGVYMAFNHKGDRLLSNGWSGQSQLWDATSGRLMLTFPGVVGGQFSLDDSMIGLERHGGKTRLWRLADGRELRTIRGPVAEPWDATRDIFAPVLDPESGVLAAASSAGLGFFDFESGKKLAFVPFRNGRGTVPNRFDPGGGWMTSGGINAVLWPMRRDPTQKDLLHIGPPRLLAATVNGGADATPDGRIRVFPQGIQTLLLDAARPGERVTFGPQHDVRYSAISPDGRWVVGCSWSWDGRSKSIFIWEVQTRRKAAELPVEGESSAQFSPDGRWLATSTGWLGTQLWEVETWRPGLRFDGGVRWSEDGRLLAVHDELSVIRWVNPESGREIFRVSGPEAKWYAAAFLTRDNAWLAGTVADNHAIYIWDLRLIRKQLKELDLDWEMPEFAALAEAEKPRAPRRIAWDPGIFRRRVFETDHQALAAYSVMLALQPVNPDASLERGLAYDQLKQPAKALADFEMFLSLTPPSERRRAEIQLRRAGLYQEVLKDDHAAAGALLAIMEEPTELTHSPGRYAFLCNEIAWRAVAPYPNCVSAKTALPLSRKAVAIEPFNFLYQNTLGVTLYRLGQYDESVHCLEANLPLSRDYAAFDLYFLAMSYHHLGESANALDCFERANASVKAATILDARERQELTNFRAEAEKALGIDSVR